MQIFVTSKNPYHAALRLFKGNKKRALKMITETQQILACCQAHFNNNKVTMLKVNGAPYSTPKSRMNHPVVKWAYSNIKNTRWLIDHLNHLYSFYTGEKFINVEYNIHVLNESIESFDLDYFTDIEFLNFAKANDKNLDFTHIANTCKAYDLFLKQQGA
ncbi:MAG: hypothetical protein HRU26_11090 [Psychroserpens sp.]|nr:hypothetical protein [Psychroserpens sp.]